MKIKGSADPVSISKTRKILDQMINCICKIKIKGANGTGFFCRIPFLENEIMDCLMTNYHVLNEKYFEENKEINILLNDDSKALAIDLGIKRKKYLNKKYDLVLIELKERDKIKNFLELDDNLFKKNEKIFYEEKSIYVLHYPNGKNACVSYGLLNKIEEYDIIHKCSTENGSSGSPILNLENNKVIGIHKNRSINFNFNMGTLLKFPLINFIKKHKNINTINNLSMNEKIINKKNINEHYIINNEDNINYAYKENQNQYSNNKIRNIIIGEISIGKYNTTKDKQIINSYENVKRIKNYKNEEDDWKYENEKNIKENIKIKINGKLIDFCYYYNFQKEGNYKIEYLFKNNLTKTDYMFYNCHSLTNLDLSNFNTQNVTNMSSMFIHCYSLINLNLSNFNTKKVTNMNGMFSNSHSLTNLNLSNFNTKKVTNMMGMFNDCNSLQKKNIITKNNEILTQLIE